MKAKRKIRKLAVIGDPISHSLSPDFQNAALKKLKLPYQYSAIRVLPKNLQAFVQGTARKLEGFNITLPHKESILPFLDRVAFEAKLIGAVNTVVHKDGKLIGFNTDGAGYLQSLSEQKKFRAKGKNILILGAGGAARALATVLSLDRAKSITIANRTLERAQALVESLSRQSRECRIKSCELKGSELKKALSRAQLLINTTSVGLYGTEFSYFPWERLNPKALVSDIVYNPRITPFLKIAKRRGHAIHTGEWMLVYQGALAFEMWTGMRPDVKLMHRTLLKALNKKK